MWMSVQYRASASQELTCPCETAVPAVFTVAVNVTTLPQGTESLSVPSEVIASVVEVVAWTARAVDAPRISRRT
jgi:hypothetical protein